MFQHQIEHTMSLFFIYLIQVNIALSLFYLLYAIVLKRDTFLRLRRLFFLSVIVFSLLYPFFTIPALSDIWTSRSSDFQEVAVTVMIGEPGMAMVLEEGTIAPIDIPWEKILFLFYITITLGFVLRFLFQLLSIYSVRAKSQKQIILGIPVYQLKKDITPFSFFNLIFIHTGKHSEAELFQILLHEQTHVRQRHSFDIMLIELVYLFSWWNPFVWLMKREMAMNLEYLADNGVLREGVDSREYQYHLLRLTYHAAAVQIVNNFNVSQLKQRIMMMNKAKSSTSTLVKYLLVAPLFFLFVVANSIYAAQNEDKSVAIQFADENLHQLSQPWIEDDNLPEPPPEKKEAEIEEVFIVSENQPEFPGGTRAMMTFLADNIRYPVKAQEKGTQGRVVCDFQVMKDGSISNVNVLHGVDPSLDAEAMRIIKLMPKWKPGTQQGQAVNVRAVLPVVFRLQGDNPQDDLLTKEEREQLFKSEVLDDLRKVDGMLIIDEVVVVAYVGKGPQAQEIIGQDKEESTTGDEMFVVVENQPRFPGGTEAMIQFLGDSIRYPKEAADKKIAGRVICNFVVMKDGSIDDVNVVRGVDPLLDAEAVRVLQSMPKWEPGTHRDKAVNVRFTLPVSFRLDKHDNSDIRTIGIKTDKNSESELAYLKALSDKIRYPVIAQENGIEGLVKAVYSVNEKGEISNVRIKQGIDPSLNSEVVRIINSLPSDIVLKKVGGKANPEVETSVYFRLQYEGSSRTSLVDSDIVVVGYRARKTS